MEENKIDLNEEFKKSIDDVTKKLTDEINKKLIGSLGNITKSIDSLTNMYNTLYGFMIFIENKLAEHDILDKDINKRTEEASKFIKDLVEKSKKAKEEADKESK